MEETEKITPKQKYYNKNIDKVKEKALSRSKAEYTCPICNIRLNYGSRVSHNKSTKHKLSERLYLLERSNSDLMY